MKMNDLRRKSKKKISIVLPTGDGSKKIRKEKSDFNFGHELELEQKANIRDLSVTSYLLQHTKKRNTGHFVLQVSNELSSMFTNQHVLGAPPTGRRFYSRNKSEFLKKIADHWNETKKPMMTSQTAVLISEQSETIDDDVSDTSAISLNRSMTPSPNNQSSKRSPIPISKVQYSRPEIAVKKGILYYSDVATLRKQIKVLSSKWQKQQFRADYGRTSYDIYRLKLNRPEITKNNFRDACITYLSTTPGGMNAITSQLT